MTRVGVCLLLVVLFSVAGFFADRVAMGQMEGNPTSSRDITRWPFDAGSHWNYPIGSGAAFQPETSVLWDVNLGGYANIEWYSIPTYVATSADPVRNVYSASSGSLLATFRVPDAARPAQGTDGSLNIIDETHSWIHEMYAAQRRSDGHISAKAYLKNDLRGMGGGFGGWHGMVAAGMSALGGMIRKGELVTGTAGLNTGIRHALQAVAPVNSLNRNAPSGGSCPGSTCRPFVWPASSADTVAFKGTGYATVGNVYMGSLLAIPPWVDIRSLGITDPQALEVARALQDYGIYIVDQGSTGGKLVIRIDPQAAGDIASRTAFVAGISKAIQQLEVVVNSHENGKKPSWGPGGGGTPRRPLAPGFESGGNQSPNVASAAMRLQYPQILPQSGFMPILAVPFATVILFSQPRRRKRGAGRQGCR